MSDANKIFLLHCLVNPLRIGINLNDVDKILPLCTLTEIPNAPPDVVGLLNYAGTSIEVIDLALRVGLKRTKTYDLDTPLVLCHHDDKQIALVMDKVLELIIVDKQQLQMRPEFNEARSPFSSVITINDSLTFILDIHKIQTLTSGLETSRLPSSTLIT